MGSAKVTNELCGTDTYTETIVGVLRFEFDGYPAPWDSAIHRYKLIGDQVTWSASGACGVCTTVGNPVTVSVRHDSAKGDIGLLFIDTRTGTYNGGAYSETLRKSTQLVYTCPGGSVTLPGQQHSFFSAYEGSGHRISDDGNTIAGMEKTADLGGNTLYEWHFTRVSPDLELVVEPGPEYDRWLPEAGADEKTPGNWLFFRAHLQNQDGSEPCAPADSFRFELVKSSKEPGICLNFPLEDKALETYDLQLDSSFADVSDIIGPEGQWIRTKEGTVGEAVVSAFDFGAWGLLKVIAFLPNGQQIVGHLKGDAAVTEIPIPKRSNNSLIADKWKEDNGVMGLADHDDSEDMPKSDSFGHTGDGLTLYEEYRGFRENNRHIFGDPKQKDFFIYNQLGASATNGIKLFEAMTKLNVRHQFQVDEFDTTNRVINFNYLDAPHQDFEQHGIWIKKVNPDSIDASRAEGGPGTPKKIKSVQIAVEPDKWRDLRRTGAKILTDEFASTVAHELGHCTNIFHHGAGDRDRMWRAKRDATDTTRYARDANGRLIVVENGTHEIDIRLEDDIPYVPSVLKTYYIALQLGMHSGYEDCIMRYDVAKAYIPDVAGISPIRYWIQDGELVGIELCDQKVGTGVNLPSRSPRPRYGNASRGECQKQICVNDLYH